MVEHDAEYFLRQVPEGLEDSLLAHVRAFLRYALPFTDGKEDAPLRLKLEHSLSVFANAVNLVREEETAGKDHDPDEIRRAILLAALYHDLGRFTQFREYRTFLDASSVNHGLLGLRALRQEGFLADESREVCDLVKTAVLLHNRYALSPKLAYDATLVTDAVRDCDKLDIMRIMALHLQSDLPERDAVLLHVEDAPDKFSPAILDNVFTGTVPGYRGLRYVNDFRLLLGLWPLDFRFASTARRLTRSGLMPNILSGLPAGKEMDRARGLILERLDARGAAAF